MVVEITPTYSGCPAMEVISRDVAEAVSAAGYRPDVRVVLSPAWSTDWITRRGPKSVVRRGDRASRPAGRGPVAVEIGRPRTSSRGRRTGADRDPSCPQCGSADVEELARFGSTACKALWRCRSCREPFDYVKPL